MSSCFVGLYAETGHRFVQLLQGDNWQLDKGPRWTHGPVSNFILLDLVSTVGGEVKSTSSK